MTYLFGPIHSRRLGVSLGVNFFKHKVCNMDCLYCEAGKTETFLTKNTYHIDCTQFEEELREFVKTRSETIDYVTFSGLGEPTLCFELSQCIDIIRSVTPCKIAVITNALLIGQDDVNAALLKADMVMPSLDSAIFSTFQEINRPKETVNVNNLIAELKKFKMQYLGVFNLEIMLLSGINTKEHELKALKKVKQLVCPDKVFLNVLDRPPAYSFVKKLTQVERERVEKIFSDKNDIIL